MAPRYGAPRRLGEDGSSGRPSPRWRGQMASSPGHPSPPLADMDHASGDLSGDSELEAMPLVQKDCQARAAPNLCLDTYTPLPSADPQSARAKAVDRGTTRDQGFPIVHFSEEVYYIAEDEGKAEIDVYRIGPLHGDAWVRCCSEDLSAVAGQHYTAADEMIHFKDGETCKTVLVEAINNDYWAPTFEFKLILSDVTNGVLDPEMHIARVKVVNDDPFPTQKFHELNALGEIVSFKLWWEFAKLNVAQPSMAWRTALVCCVDQLHNLYIFFKLWFNVYLVDVVLTVNDDTEQRLLFPGDRIKTVLLLAVLYVVPVAVLHLWDRTKLKMGLGGRTLGFLQQSLFRHYLNYDAQSLAEVPSADLVFSVMHDCKRVMMSFLCAVDMVTAFLKVFILSFFLYHKNRDSLWMMAAVPAIMILFCVCRMAMMTRIIDASNDAEIDILEHVTDVTQNFSLVADYHQQSLENNMFVSKFVAWKSCRMPHLLMNQTNTYFPAWICTIFIGLNIFTNAPGVIQQSITLGVFLASISTINEVCACFGHLYALFMVVNKSIEPLASLTVLYNKQTALGPIMRACKNRKQEVEEERVRLYGKYFPGKVGKVEECAKLYDGFIDDEMHIGLKDVSLAYTRPGSGERCVIFNKEHILTPQGEMVAVIGPHGAGMGSLMNLIGHSLPPYNGCVVMPSYYNCLHVKKDPLFMAASLWENLCLGITRPEPKDADRVRKVLELLELDRLVKLCEKEVFTREHADSTEVFTVLESDADERSGLAGVSLSGPRAWLKEATPSEKARVNLARAILKDPYVLVLEQPLSHFNCKIVGVVLGVLKAFVRDRGVGYAGHAAARPPKTMFYSTQHASYALEATRVWRVRLEGPGAPAQCHVEEVVDRSLESLTACFEPTCRKSPVSV